MKFGLSKQWVNMDLKGSLEFFNLYFKKYMQRNI